MSGQMPDAARLRADISNLETKLADLRAQHEARTVAFGEERNAQNEADESTLAELAKLRLDLDVAPESVSLCKVPGSKNFGPGLLQALADAREALSGVKDALTFRIDNGPHGGDPEINRLTSALARVEADLQGAKDRWQAARQEALKWLAQLEGEAA